MLYLILDYHNYNHDYHNDRGPNNYVTEVNTEVKLIRKRFP